MKLATIALVGAMLAGGMGAVSAAPSPRQIQNCPNDYECVQVGSTIYAIDPDDGPVVGVVDAITTTSTETLSSAGTVVVVGRVFGAQVFALVDGEYQAITRLTEEATGRYADVKLGDTLVLGPASDTEATTQDG